MQASSSASKRTAGSCRGSGGLHRSGAMNPNSLGVTGREPQACERHIRGGSTAVVESAVTAGVEHSFPPHERLRRHVPATPSRATCRSRAAPRVEPTALELGRQGSVQVRVFDSEAVEPVGEIVAAEPGTRRTAHGRRSTTRARSARSAASSIDRPAFTWSRTGSSMRILEPAGLRRIRAHDEGLLDEAIEGRDDIAPRSSGYLDRGRPGRSLRRTPRGIAVRPARRRSASALPGRAGRP